MRRAVIACLIGCALLFAACGDSLGKRINNACVNHQGLARVNPYGIFVNGEIVREVICRDGTTKVVLHGTGD